MKEPNISPWRRAVCGDLTSAFDFADPAQGGAKLPDTSHYLDRAAQSKALPAPQIPPLGALPRQEPGQRPSRALPYDFDVKGRVDRDARTFVLEFANNGRAGVCFDVRSRTPGEGPWFYTVEAGKRLIGALPIGSDYHLAVRGPNGFLYETNGQLDSAEVTVVLEKDPLRGALLVNLRNNGERPEVIHLVGGSYWAPRGSTHTLVPNRDLTIDVDVLSDGRWYDLCVRTEDSRFLRRFAGRLETGKPGVSDPAIGRRV